MGFGRDTKRTSVWLRASAYLGVKVVCLLAPHISKPAYSVQGKADCPETHAANGLGNNVLYMARRHVCTHTRASVRA